MDLLNAMLVLDPQKRPPAQDILNHKWFDALKGLSPPLEPYQCPDPTTHLSSKEAVHIFHHLRTLGFDAPSILQSVKQDACDSLCAMWYLLKLKLGNAATESSFGEDCPPNLDSLVLGIVNSNPRGSPGSSTWLSPQTATTPFGGGAQEPSIRRAPWVTESSRVKGPMGMGSLHRSHQAPGSPGLAGTLSSKKGQPRPQSAGATVHRNHTFSTSSRRSSTVMEECEEDDEF